MSGPTVNSSDLEFAKKAADRLKAEQEAARAREAAGGASSGYTRFAAGSFSAAAAAGVVHKTAPIAPGDLLVEAAATRAASPAVVEPEPAVPAAPSLEDVPAFGASGFNTLLDWCLEATQAESAFIVDDRGLPVAERGAFEGEQVRELGARLVAAFDQLQRMQLSDAPAESMLVELGPRRLSGINVDFGAGQFMAVGIVGPRVAATEVRRIVNTTLRTWMGAD